MEHVTKLPARAELLLRTVEVLRIKNLKIKKYEP